MATDASGSAGAGFGNTGSAEQGSSPDDDGSGLGAAGMGAAPMAPSAPPDGAFGGASGETGSGLPATTPDPQDSCVVERRPVHGLGLHLVVDESIAMVFPQDLWTPLAQALDAFVATDAAAPLAIGVQFFQGTCDRTEYAEPALPLAPVSERQDVLAQSMSGRAHGFGAATALALDGAIEHARAWSIAENRRAALVLISGSEPSGCSEDAQAAADAARAGLAIGPALATYVLALRARDGLEQIAQAGATGAAIGVADASSEAELESALARVAERAACELALPASASAYLPDRVNVRVTRDGQTTYLPHVAGAASCDALAGGFYYDDAQSPTRVLLCPQSCANTAQGASVELVFGCATASL